MRPSLRSAEVGVEIEKRKTEEEHQATQCHHTQKKGEKGSQFNFVQILVLCVDVFTSVCIDGL